MNNFTQARQDLNEDFEEIQYLYSCLQQNAIKFIREIIQNKQNIAKLNFTLIYKNHNYLTKLISKYLNEAKSISFTEANPEQIREEKIKHYNLLRLIYKLSGCLITSSDWQSP